MHWATSLPLCHMGTYHQGDDNIVFKQFPIELWPACPVLAHQALLNTNSKLFFWRMTGVVTVKTEKKNKLKCILSHLKNRCPTEPIRYKLICKQNVFCYLVFCSYPLANNPNRFHFLLKVLLPSKFIAKSTFRLLKWALKRHSNRNMTKASLSVAWKSTMR